MLKTWYDKLWLKRSNFNLTIMVKYHFFIFTEISILN